MHILVMRHSCADTSYLRGKVILTEIMAGIGDAVLTTPIVDFSGISLQKHIGHKVPKIITNFLVIFLVKEKTAKMLQDIIAISFLKAGGKLISPGNSYLSTAGKGHIVWLIGKDCRNGPAKFIAHLFKIELVGGVEECLDHLLAQDIHIAITIKIWAIRTVNYLKFSFAIHQLASHRFYAILLSLGGDNSPGKTAWPAVLIIKISQHAHFFSKRDGCLYPVHPLGRKIRGDEPNAGVHKEAPYPLFLHLLYLPA